MQLYELILPFKKIKWAYQRVKKGYSDWDLGDIDIWFLETIPKMLKEYKERNSGIPNEIYEDYFETEKDIGVSYEEFRRNWDDEIEAKVVAKWHKILDRMIFCFNEANEDSCSMKNEYEKEYIESKFTKSESYFKREKEIRLYREEMLKEGFKLFEKYFRNLWI